jgi:hypothetical protein
MGQPVAGVVTVTYVDGRQIARTKADETVGYTVSDLAASAAPSAASSSSGRRFAAIICQSFLRERTDLCVTQRSG